MPLESLEQKTQAVLENLDDSTIKSILSVIENSQKNIDNLMNNKIEDSMRNILIWFIEKDTITDIKRILNRHSESQDVINKLEQATKEYIEQLLT